ncbi:hypothetical protein BaRGS_00009225 [Batillaria attramentaria]|uniref:Uncharacterized protein n=1 Tax=Batillaria attramentaria TaxID=370345 RepID=A0ABD0LK64_9CAEN
MEKAANYSEGENTIAIFDLALLYKELGHLHKALELLEEIMYCRKILFCDPYRINAYEEAGLILKEISEKEKAKDKKQQLRGQAEAMLNMALTLASRVYSKVAQVEEHRGEIHLSFSTLLKAVEDSDHKAQEKLWQKARLFKLIKDHKQSLNLLRDMAKMDPAEENKPARLKMCVENYMDMQQYENAVAFIELLQCTSAAAQLFEDKHYVQKVYVQAAKQALLLSSSTARSHFHAAFVDTYTDTKQTTSSSDDSDFTENKQDTWDVMILCEQESESKAEQLTKLLEDACGLKVTYCDKHVRPGTLKVKGVLQIMKRSRLVVVLIGSDKASVELDFFINIAVLRPSTVTLLVEHNRNRVPQLLKAHRRMPCPGGLLDVTQQQGRPYSQSTIDGICKLFSFFINIGE